MIPPPPHATNTVTFSILVDDLGYYYTDCTYRVEDGTYTIHLSTDGAHFETNLITVRG